ncbi:MAG TPA: Hpt domain-containing protein [Noviherbaspirillum sp.]
MTPPLSPTPQDGREQLDTGPLSWVMGEIREALNRSKQAVREALEQDTEARATSLRHAKSYLHQAHGALQIVDVDGIALITETVEDLFDRIDAGQLALSTAVADAIGTGYQALVEYLEELLSGVPHQPVRLFPYYRALLEARGAERIHPADLFFPNLAMRPQFASVPASVAIEPGRYIALRQRYERALLPFLKSSDKAVEAQNAAIMRDLIAEIEGMQANSQTRAFWWVMHGLAEAVADGAIANEIYVKQLFARINLQIRRLCMGSASIAERLLRDALFFIAGVAEPNARCRQIRDVYELDGLVPTNYDRKRYGQVNVDALVAAKERLAQAKSLWNRLAGGDAANAESFEHEMRALADAGSRLNAAPLSKLLKELKGIARHAAHSRPGDMLGMEMATSLLFVENALQQIAHLPENFAERADSLTARLLAIMAGETPPQALDWLDDMSREAQQRQTMAALAGEMQTSLRQVEKMLDEYFRDPSQATALDQLDTALYQIEGALAVLDHEDAVRTLRHTREAVQRFRNGQEEASASQQDFQQVAQNVGALSFFIEALHLPSEQATRRFAFDEQRGVFEANLIEKRKPGSPPSPKVIEVADTPAVASVAPSEPAPQEPVSLTEVVLTVEDELIRHQRDSVELAKSLRDEPNNADLKQQLKHSLEQVHLDATLLDNPELSGRARAGLEMLERTDFSATPEALGEITSNARPSAAPPVVPASSLPSDEEIDAELLEIFLAEAEEVLTTVGQTLPESRNHPHDQEHLTTLRRCFHTLKGSGRMVGLVAFGEAAWGIEQVLNLRLSESKPGDADLYALLEKAAEFLGGWVRDLAQSGRSDCMPDALVRAAQAVKSGAGFVFEDAPVPSVLLTAERAVQCDVTQSEQAQAQPEVPALEVAADCDEAAVGELPDLIPVDEVPMSDEELALFEEQSSPESVHALDEPAFMSNLSAARVIDFPAPQPAERAVDDNIKRIGDVEIGVPLYNIYLAETDDLVRLLERDLGEWRHEPQRPVAVQSVHAAHSLAGSSATVGLDALHEVAHALEKVLQFVMRRPVALEVHEFDTLEHTVARLKLMLQKVALGEMPAHEPEYLRLLDSILVALERRVAPMPAAAIDEIKEFDEVMDVQTRAEFPVPPQETAIEAIEETATHAADSESAVSTPLFGEPVLALRDELDSDLLPVFIEEGRDMLPEMGQALRNWQAEPEAMGWPQALLRLLHTLKGSARMAGAMNLGQHLHDMETRTENLMRLGLANTLAIDDLLVRYDQGLQMFEMLQNPQATVQQAHEIQHADELQKPADVGVTSSASVVLSPVVPVLNATAVSPVVAERAAMPAAPGLPTTLVRVRADILDRLVNQAGEVSISRSRLETGVGTLRQSLSELTENVGRLREQLREIEMQAESQIVSRMQHAGDREFDPLEFDRFTRLQELTRMMAESVSDVGSVHSTLARTLDAASGDLSAQARLTRELQQDLMRVRMVQFASISERLYRVTRQAAKEVDKRVNLDIRGGAVEMDRGVLEKMVGPFEHLLRNAIVHGIETREARRLACKSETGELLVEARQEGNEVVLQFSDDGQGLNVARIREKGVRLGLLSADGNVPDSEIQDLIFHPGFSTAEEITELAGRGVGMDVVRSEAAALGGRVELHSEPGKGACFTIRLPLTLAVTQVVLVSTGGRTYAVPSVLVEQVQQLKANALTAAYNESAVIWQGQRVALHYLSTLLGDRIATPVAQQYTPLLIVKSGNERVALHVDEIVGNREVVVKNIGPQLARMIGIAGATVLGSGDIVLILNPVPLAQRAAQEDVRAPRLLPSEAAEGLGAVAEVDGGATGRHAAPVQGLRTQSIVMVVDDSLTVRRVTQRLLSREGYQVVLAKDGVDALERLQSITPDVMLVDIEMPRMDGFDLTRNVRDDQRTRHIPIIMITSRTASKHRNYALELGVNEYLGKPYQEERLLELIAGFVGSKTSAE